MTCLLSLVLLLSAADEPKDPQPIEKVLAAKEKPELDKPIVVTTHILVGANNGKKGLLVKFNDIKGSPNVHIKQWDDKSAELKAGTEIKVVGQLHFGPVSAKTPSIRYKIVDANGKPYNDHRHWRTDQAIYIVNPTFEIVEAE